MKFEEFNPARDMPSLSGKCILITGGTAGLGKDVVLALAKIQNPPSRVYFTGRAVSTDKAAAVETEFLDALPLQAKSTSKAVFVPCDLASLANVKQAAGLLVTYLQENDPAATPPRLDVVICNAGIMAVPPSVTKDGFEIQFGTNYMGHALLVKLLLSNLVAAKGRIVSVTSQGQGFADIIPGGIAFSSLLSEQTGSGFGFLGTWKKYGQSKLANVLFAREIARRYPDVTAISIHPGVVNTGLVSTLGFWNNLLVKVGARFNSPEDGIKNHLWAIGSEKSAVKNGGYYEPVGEPGRKTRYNEDSELAAKLWDWTEKELGKWTTT
ncbi:hypothetical protein HDU93_005163 [Gonapodya sp. JEL0774]|nr:hypothetical protein HDU93_005163 [Gonapodya sp. JEL0774]